MTFDEKMQEIKSQYPRLKRLSEVDCTICGYFEVYYSDKESDIVVRTCPSCNYIRVIDVKRLPTYGG